MRRLPASPIWAVAGLVPLGAVVGVLLVGVRPTEYRHPHPRPGVSAATVLPDSALPDVPAARPGYAAARAYPAVLDGLHCYCNCKLALSHRSLLACFEDRHGAACEVCQQEAVLAAEMTGAGTTLERVRRAIDGRFAA